MPSCHAGERTHRPKQRRGDGKNSRAHSRYCPKDLHELGLITRGNTASVLASGRSPVQVLAGADVVEATAVEASTGEAGAGEAIAVRPSTGIGALVEATGETAVETRARGRVAVGLAVNRLDIGSSSERLLTDVEQGNEGIIVVSVHTTDGVARVALLATATIAVSADAGKLSTRLAQNRGARLS